MPTIQFREWFKKNVSIRKCHPVALSTFLLCFSLMQIRDRKGNICMWHSFIQCSLNILAVENNRIIGLKWLIGCSQAQRVQLCVEDL